MAASDAPEGDAIEVTDSGAGFGVLGICNGERVLAFITAMPDDLREFAVKLWQIADQIQGSTVAEPPQDIAGHA